MGHGGSYGTWKQSSSVKHLETDKIGWLVYEGNVGYNLEWVVDSGQLFDKKVNNWPKVNSMEKYGNFWSCVMKWIFW